jgi:antitoxin YefM
MNINITSFREKLAESLDRVVRNREVLRVTRQNAETVVVMSEGEFESVMETLHLLRSPANARALLEAIADVEAGRITEFRP